MNNNIPQKIKDFNKNREAIPLQIKYRFMAEDAFRFFRGTCQLFYDELCSHYPFPDSPAVWACGDCHIENFGSYKGSNRLVYFDMNDFDEALLAPALWEIGRLAVSIEVAAATAAFSPGLRADLVDKLLSAYRLTLQKAKSLVIERETARGLIKKLVNRVADRKEMELVKKRTDSGNSEKLQVCDALLALPKTEKKALLTAFEGWLADNGHPHLQVLDAGFRIAGTGSIGIKRYIVLLAHSLNPKKKLLLDIKQAIPSGPAVYASLPQPLWQHEAARMITVQEMVQHVSPAFLSAFQYSGSWFVVRELQPTADKVNMFQAVKEPAQMENYCTDLGMITASAQLRSSGRMMAANADALSSFAFGEGWVNTVKEWAAAYAEQVQQEFMAYQQAWKDGFFRN